MISPYGATYISEFNNLHVRRPEEATILCSYNDSYDLKIGNTYAIPCNGKVECIDGQDEQDCDLPDYLILKVLCLVASLLCIALFLYLKVSIKKKVKLICQNKVSDNQQPDDPNHAKSKKLLYMAMLIENDCEQELQELYKREIEAHGNEVRVMHCMKVLISFFQFFFSIASKHLFDTLL